MHKSTRAWRQIYIAILTRAFPPPPLSFDAAWCHNTLVVSKFRAGVRACLVLFICIYIDRCGSFWACKKKEALKVYNPIYGHLRYWKNTWKYKHQVMGCSKWQCYYDKNGKVQRLGITRNALMELGWLSRGNVSLGWVKKLVCPYGFCGEAPTGYSTPSIWSQD